MYLRLLLYTLRCYPASIHLIRYFVSLFRCNKLPTPYCASLEKAASFHCCHLLSLSYIHLRTSASIFSHKSWDCCHTCTQLARIFTFSLSIFASIFGALRVLCRVRAIFNFNCEILCMYTKMKCAPWLPHATHTLLQDVPHIHRYIHIHIICICAGLYSVSVHLAQ